MKPLRKAIAFPIAAAALALASPAVGQEVEGVVVPPENSAVNQYTESFPTARGEKDAHEQRGGRRSPDKVLGDRNARRLDRQGAEGRAVAELATETAPVAEEEAPPEESREEEPQTGSGGGGGGDGKGGGPPARDRPDANRVATPPVRAPEADGSSGFGEVIAHATGSSSEGGMGILLLLVIVGTILWAFTHLLRQRRPVG